jgi:hypothetical protein
MADARVRSFWNASDPWASFTLHTRSLPSLANLSRGVSSRSHRGAGGAGHSAPPSAHRTARTGVPTAGPGSVAGLRAAMDSALAAAVRVGRTRLGARLDHNSLTTNSPRFVAPYWPSGYKGPRSDPVSSRIREAPRSSRRHPYPVPTRDPPALPPGSYEVSRGP